MHHILYISTTRTAMTDAELDTLLQVSRRNNARCNVTGLLVVGGRRFLQCLEGPEESVRETFARISRDPRHFAVVTLANKVITERSFSQWAMGFERGGDTSADRTLHDQLADIIAPISNRNLQAYFSGFVKSHGSPPKEVGA